MRTVLARLLVTLAVVMAARVASGEDAVASVSWVTGAVTVLRAGQQAPEDVKTGAKLFRGDRIQAKNGADAGLIIGGATRNLSSFAESRWVAGEPLEAPAPTLWQRLKEKAFGAEQAARPGGPDFARVELREKLKKEIAAKGILALLGGHGDEKGLADVLGGEGQAFAHMERGSGGSGAGGFGGVGIGDLLNQKSGGGGTGAGYGGGPAHKADARPNRLARMRDEAQQKLDADEGREPAAGDEDAAPGVTFRIPGASKAAPAQLTILAGRGGASVFTMRVIAEKQGVPDGQLDPATRYRWKVKRGKKESTGAFTSPRRGEKALVIEVPGAR